MKIHPAPIGHPEALVELTAHQRLPCVLITAVAHEQRGDVRIHMGGTRLDTGHAVLIRHLFAGLVDLPGQMGYAEHVDILEALGLPELRLFGENVLVTERVKVHGDSQRRLLRAAAVDVELTLVDGTKPLNGLLTCHGKASSRVKFLAPRRYFFTRFRNGNHERKYS